MIQLRFNFYCSMKHLNLSLDEIQTDSTSFNMRVKAFVEREAQEAAVAVKRKAKDANVD